MRARSTLLHFYATSALQRNGNNHTLDCSSTSTSGLSLCVLETFLALTAIWQQILLMSLWILLFRYPFQVSGLKVALTRSCYLAVLDTWDIRSKKWGSMMTLSIPLLCACNIRWREPIWCEHYVDPSERRELLLAERADEYLDVVVPHWNTRPKHAGHDAAASHGRSAVDWGTLARHSSESVVAGDTNRKSKQKFFTKEARVL